MGPVTAFLEDDVVARGDRQTVARELAQLYPDDHGRIRAFEDGSGRIADLDYREALREPEPAGRGRPRLGVVAREVTLLPVHWEWLGQQRGGASAVLRRLVDEARRREPGAGEKRDSAYRFMSHMCGDRPGYEEALRALYRGEQERFRNLVADWPPAIRDYLGELLA
ncbi:MAG: DUF2239 family protein [Allosphingosinicella sp.]